MTFRSEAETYELHLLVGTEAQSLPGLLFGAGMVNSYPRVSGGKKISAPHTHVVSEDPS